MTTLTIGIKALNEERHVEAAIRTAVAAAAAFGGDVVLADSGSTDRTLDIARTLPVKIVQLADVSQRCCGAGAQLAFQFAKGDYFYLMDGDMELEPDFCAAGIAYLEAHPDVGGVGGIVREMNVDNHEFRIRANALAAKRAWSPGVVDRLDCGGLYRAAAIRDVEYFADRNLHAFEEFELAARLQSRGWKLARIDQLAVYHYGHQTDGYKLLWRRISSGYSTGIGEVVRAAAGRRHFPVVLRNLSHLRFCLVVFLWWAALVASASYAQSFVLALLLMSMMILGPIAALAVRRGSFSLGVYSFLVWNVSALGLLVGFVRPRTKPQRPLEARLLSVADVQSAQ